MNYIFNSHEYRYLRSENNLIIINPFSNNGILFLLNNTLLMIFSSLVFNLISNLNIMLLLIYCFCFKLRFKSILFIKKKCNMISLYFKIYNKVLSKVTKIIINQIIKIIRI